MSRLLTQEEIEALLAGGLVMPDRPEPPAPDRAAPAAPRLAIGDRVDIVSDGVIVARGEIVLLAEGRPGVRIVTSAEQRSTKGGSIR